jgi:hypothetical protein
VFSDCLKELFDEGNHIKLFTLVDFEGTDSESVCTFIHNLKFEHDVSCVNACDFKIHRALKRKDYSNKRMRGWTIRSKDREEKEERYGKQFH